MLRKFLDGWIGSDDESPDSDDSRPSVDNPPPSESERSSTPRWSGTDDDSTSVTAADSVSPDDTTTDSTSPDDSSGAGGSSSADDEFSSLGTSELSRTLTAVRRRYVLEYLTSHDEVLTLEELAEWVVTRDDGDVTDAEAVAIALHHWHLPKLTEADLVDYDSATRTVEPGSKLGDVSARLPAAAQ